MKKILFSALSIILIASCSTPKYSYYFDHYDYNSGKRSTAQREVSSVAEIPQASPLAVNQESLVANAEPGAVVIADNKKLEETKSAFVKKYAAMTKSERKEFKKELKSEVKKQIKAKKSGERDAAVKGTNAMDHDLKMALIFGVVGLVLTLFGAVSSVFWVLGVISIVIGVVFLVMWLSRQ